MERIQAVDHHELKDYCIWWIFPHLHALSSFFVPKFGCRTYPCGHCCCIIVLSIIKYKRLCYLLVWKYPNMRSSSSKAMKMYLMLIVLAFIYIMTNLFIRSHRSPDRLPSSDLKKGWKLNVGFGFFSPSYREGFRAQLRPMPRWLLGYTGRSLLHRHFWRDCLEEKKPKLIYLDLGIR